MNTGASSRTSNFLRYALLACAVAYVVLYIVLAFFRIRYPFELEWQEGGTVDHVRRILSGETLYVPPSLEFIPFIYTPLYYYVSAVASKIVGVGFVSLRLVSTISSLGCFLVIFLMVRRETGSTFSGALASGLFAATFKISGSWFDIARVDSLFLFLLLLALYLIRFKASLKSYVLAGALISLSFLTKQTALLVSLPVMAYCVYSNRRSGAVLIGVSVAGIGLSTLLLNNIHDGWYVYYIFDLPRKHAVVKSMILGFWAKDLVWPLPIAFGLSVFSLFADLRAPDKKRSLFYPAMAVGMLGGSWFSRLHLGGDANVLFPAYAAIAILFGIGTHRALGLVLAAPQSRANLMEILVCVLCILQFSFLVYNPLRQVPTEKDAEAGRRFIRTMSQMEGEVFVPYHGYLPVLAGKNTHAHAMAMIDVLRGDEEQARVRLALELRQALMERRFGAIILDSGQFMKDWFQKKDFEGYCMTEQPFFEDESVFWTISGMKTRPQTIVYVCPEDD